MVSLIIKNKGIAAWRVFCTYQFIIFDHFGNVKDFSRIVIQTEGGDGPGQGIERNVINISLVSEMGVT